jgi:hypothetical protein
MKAAFRGNSSSSSLKSVSPQTMACSLQYPIATSSGSDRLVCQTFQTSLNSLVRPLLSCGLFSHHLECEATSKY